MKIDIEHGIANKIYRAFAAFCRRGVDRSSR